MRKIFFILFILLGIGIIGTGIFLQLDSKKENTKDVEESEKKETETFQRLNTFNLEETCTTNDSINTYVETVTFAKVNFNYPNCIHEYNLNESYKFLKNEDGSISMTVSKDKDTMKKYMNKQKTQIIAYKNNPDYQNIAYSDIISLTTENSIEVSFIEFNYQYGLSSYDFWYICAKIDDSYILTFEIKSKDKIISYEVIKKLINSIELKENTAEFTNSTIEGNYQIGSLKQNFNNSYEHGFKLNYRISTDYPEVESVSTNYDQSNFEYKDINKDFFVTISLNRTTMNKTLKDEIESYSQNVGTSYENNPEIYRNNKNSGVIEKNINGKDIYYFTYSYDYYSESEKTNSYEIGCVCYEITENFFYKIYISNRNYPITENFISQFLNFTLEEY